MSSLIAFEDTMYNNKERVKSVTPHIDVDRVKSNTPTLDAYDQHLSSTDGWDRGQNSIPLFTGSYTSYTSCRISANNATLQPICPFLSGCSHMSSSAWFTTCHTPNPRWRYLRWRSYALGDSSNFQVPNSCESSCLRHLNRTTFWCPKKVGMLPIGPTRACFWQLRKYPSAKKKIPWRFMYSSGALMKFLSTPLEINMEPKIPPSYKEEIIFQPSIFGLTRS